MSRFRPISLFVIALAFGCLTSSALGQTAEGTGKPAPSHLQKKFDPKRDAAKDIAYAVALAKKENKRIILDVGGEWCGWCKKLDKFFEENAEAAKILKESYLLVKVNFSQENENKAILSKYPKINGYPHLFVLEKDGKLLHSQDTGLLETGDHHDAAKVIPFLKKWAKG